MIRCWQQSHWKKVLLFFAHNFSSPRMIKSTMTSQYSQTSGFIKMSKWDERQDETTETKLWWSYTSHVQVPPEKECTKHFRGFLSTPISPIWAEVLGDWQYQINSSRINMNKLPLSMHASWYFAVRTLTTDLSILILFSGDGRRRERGKANIKRDSYGLCNVAILLKCCTRVN